MLRYFGKYAKRVSVTEPEESDFPDKRQRDGIDVEASVIVDNKLLSALSDAVSTPCNQAAVRGTLPPPRVHHDYTDYLTSLFIKVLKKTSNLHENSGTVEYFAGQ